MEKTLSKEHRILDETDLVGIDNTFKLINKTLEFTNERINSTNERINSLEKSTNYRIDNLKYLMSIGFTLIGILIAVLKFI